MMVQGAALEAVAHSKLRRVQASSKSSNCTDVQNGGSVLLYKASNRNSALRWRGPAKISDVDDAGVAVKFQCQTFKVARYSARVRGMCRAWGMWIGTLRQGDRILLGRHALGRVRTDAKR